MRLALLGGFLGSGKTTALVEACLFLRQQGKKVGVVTNDQGQQQVDSAFVKSFGIPTREVSNGCFCCNFHELETQLQDLKENQSPDIIFAESVGSCADLVATLVKPFQTLSPDLNIVVSIFVDAGLATSVLEGRSSFLDESVQYIFKKQLEEADLIILNKSDTISASQLDSAKKIIQSEYPGKMVLPQNSLNNVDIVNWLKVQDQFKAPSSRASLKIDYATYGMGEARLAWLDKNVRIQTLSPDAVFVAYNIIKGIFKRVQMERLPVGHLKFFLNTDDWSDKVSLTAASTGYQVPANSIKSNTVNVLINSRVQTDPDTLRLLVQEELENVRRNFNCSIMEEECASFSPGFPKPTHRIA